MVKSPEVKKTTVMLPEDLLEWLKQHAFNSEPRKTMGKVIREVLLKYHAKEEKKK